MSLDRIGWIIETTGGAVEEVAVVAEPAKGNSSGKLQARL